MNGPSRYLNVVVVLQFLTYAMHPFSVASVCKSLMDTEFLTQLGIMSVDNIVCGIK
jgi:hypothetical protein